MSHFSDGISAYKLGDYSRAIDEFHAAIEENDQDHRAWNALGTALSKSGDYEGAATCFENALILAPDNATYLKNQDRNDAKRGSTEDEIELDDEPPIKKPSIKVEEPLGLGVTICVVIGFLFGIVSAILALFFGGLASAFGASETDFIIGRAWIGIFLSFVGLPCPFVKHKSYSMLILGLTGLMILFVMGFFGLITGILYLLAGYLIYRNVGINMPYYIDFSTDKFKKGLYSLIILLVIVVSASGMSMNSKSEIPDIPHVVPTPTIEIKSDPPFEPTITVSTQKNPTDDDCQYSKILLKTEITRAKLEQYTNTMSDKYATQPSVALNAVLEAKNYLVDIKNEIQVLDVSPSNQESKALYMQGIDTLITCFDRSYIFLLNPSEQALAENKDIPDLMKSGLNDMALGVDESDSTLNAQCIVDGRITIEEFAEAATSLNTTSPPTSGPSIPIDTIIAESTPSDKSTGQSIAVTSEDNPVSDQSNSDISNVPYSGYDFSSATHATLMAVGKNWNSDAQNDGVVVYPDLKDDNEQTVQWSGETLPVDVEIWTLKMNDQFKYVQDRLVYSGSGTISSWKDGNMFMNGGIRVPFSQMSVHSGDSYGRTFVRIHLPNQGVIESQYDITPLNP